MKKTLMVIMIVLLLVCNAYSDKKGAALLPKAIGPNTDLRVKSSGLTAVSVADLPSSPTAGDTYWVDDATSACVLGAGGGGVESEFKWDGSAWTGSLCSTGTGLAVTDIDTLAELNGIIGDANLYSTAEIDALLAKAALLGVLDLETTDSPTYAGMTLSGAGGLVLGAAGTVMGTARWYTNVAENVYRFDLFSSDFTQNWGIRWQTGYPTENGGLFTVGTPGTGTWSYQGVDPGDLLLLPADPAAHTLFGFDNTTNTYKPFTIGTGLSFDQASATLSASGGVDTSSPIGATAFTDLTGGASYTNFGGATDDTINELFAALDTALGGLAGGHDAVTINAGIGAIALTGANQVLTAHATIEALVDNSALSPTWSNINPTFGTVTAANFESSCNPATGECVSTIPNNTTDAVIPTGETGIHVESHVLKMYENGVEIGPILSSADIDTPSELETVAGLGAFASDLLGYADAAAVRTGLGLVIGTNVQAYDADHSSLASGISGLVWGLGNGNGYQAATRANFGVMDTVGTFAAPTTTNPYTLPAANCYGSTIYYGATGEIDLPAGVDGMNIIIYNTGAFTVTIDPNASEVITRDGTAQTGGVSMTLSSGAGNYVCLIFDGTQWVTKGYKGTLAVGT